MSKKQSNPPPSKSTVKPPGPPSPPKPGNVKWEQKEPDVIGDIERAVNMIRNGKRHPTLYWDTISNTMKEL